jgi:hypothetical protein
VSTTIVVEGHYGRFNGRAKHIQRVRSIAAIGMAMIAANRGVNVRFPQYDALIVPTDCRLVNVRRIHPVYGNRRHKIRSINSSPVVTIAVSLCSRVFADNGTRRFGIQLYRIKAITQLPQI